jgi:hypothetical protein
MRKSFLSNTSPSISGLKGSGTFLLGIVLSSGLVWGQTPTPTDAAPTRDSGASTGNADFILQDIFPPFFSPARNTRPLASANDSVQSNCSSPIVAEVIFVKQSTLKYHNEAVNHDKELVSFFNEAIAAKDEGSKIQTQASLEANKAKEDADSTLDTGKINAANAKLELLQKRAADAFNRCEDLASKAADKASKVQYSLTMISQSFRDCASNGSTPKCDVTKTNNNEDDFQTEVVQRVQGCSQTVESVNRLIAKDKEMLSELSTYCDKLANDTFTIAGYTLGQIGVGAGLLALGAGAALVIKNNSGKKGDRGGPTAPPPPPAGGGGSGTDQSLVPPAGSSDGCPAGQVRNFNGVCVVPSTPNPGSGGGTQTPTPIVTIDPVPFNPTNPPGGLGSGGGGQGPVGRDLAGDITTGNPAGDRPTLGSGGDTLPSTTPGGDSTNPRTRNLFGGGGGGNDNNFNNPSGDKPAPKSGPVTETSGTSRYRIQVTRDPKNIVNRAALRPEQKVLFLTRRECLGIFTKEYCEAQIKKADRGLASQIKNKKSNLLK